MSNEQTSQASTPQVDHSTRHGITTARRSERGNGRRPDDVFAGTTSHAARSTANAQHTPGRTERQRIVEAQGSEGTEGPVKRERWGAHQLTQAGATARVVSAQRSAAMVTEATTEATTEAAHTSFHQQAVVPPTPTTSTVPWTAPTTRDPASQGSAVSAVSEPKALERVSSSHTHTGGQEEAVEMAGAEASQEQDPHAWPIRPASQTVTARQPPQAAPRIAPAKQQPLRPDIPSADKPAVTGREPTHWALGDPRSQHNRGDRGDRGREGVAESTARETIARQHRMPPATEAAAEGTHAVVPKPAGAPETPLERRYPIRSRSVTSAMAPMSDVLQAMRERWQRQRQDDDHERSTTPGTKGTKGTQAPTPSKTTPVCPHCGGAGYVRLDVPVGDPAFGKPIPCVCRERQWEEQRRLDLRRLSNIDAFVGLTFTSFNPRVPGIEEAYRVARRYARGPHGWLVLRGGYGCGKTHLAAAIANAQLAAGVQVLFSVVPDLLDHLRAAFVPNRSPGELVYAELFERVREAELLILDDLGTQHETGWVAEKLFQIINFRYNFRMPTVITTNQHAVSARKPMDERIASRLSDISLVQTIVIKAPDYRKHHIVLA